MKASDESVTERLDIEGFCVYVQQRSDGHVIATIRSQPWPDRSKPLERIHARSVGMAVAKVREWVREQQPTQPADPLETSNPVSPLLGTEPPDMWKVDELDDDGTPHLWQSATKEDRQRLHQLKMFRARALLGIYNHPIRSKTELKERLAELAKTDHPEAGGDTTKWEHILKAYRYLSENLTFELPSLSDAEFVRQYWQNGGSSRQT